MNLIPIRKMKLKLNCKNKFKTLINKWIKKDKKISKFYGEN